MQAIRRLTYSRRVQVKALICTSPYPSNPAERTIDCWGRSQSKRAL